MKSSPSLHEVVFLVHIKRFIQGVSAPQIYEMVQDAVCVGWRTVTGNAKNSLTCQRVSNAKGVARSNIIICSCLLYDSFYDNLAVHYTGRIQDSYRVYEDRVALIIETCAFLAT